MKKSNLDIDKYIEWARKDWYDLDINMKSIKDRHRKNINNLKKVEEYRDNPDRPIYIAVFHGSGRHMSESCAHEMSNSQMFLERGLELALKEWEGEVVEVDRHVLREYLLEPCNACYSTASALCNFSCSCFPHDDISTKIYPSIMKADILLWSTPVNQASISTRTKIVLDRLISLDGGYYIEELPIKDDLFRQQAIELSTQQDVEYDPRMFGKIAGYFVTTKDLENDIEESAPYPEEFKNLTYKDTVIGQLSIQGTEYGWFHPDPFYAVSIATHNQEMSYDKAEYNSKLEDHKQAKEVVLASLKMAEEFRKKYPELKSKGRINRT